MGVLSSRLTVVCVVHEALFDPDVYCVDEQAEQTLHKYLRTSMVSNTRMTDARAANVKTREPFQTTAPAGYKGLFVQIL